MHRKCHRLFTTEVSTGRVDPRVGSGKNSKNNLFVWEQMNSNIAKILMLKIIF